VNDIIDRFTGDGLVFLDIDLERFREAILELRTGVPRRIIDEGLRTDDFMTAMASTDREWYMQRIQTLAGEQGVTAAEVRKYVVGDAGEEASLSDLLLRVDPAREGIPENISGAASSARDYHERVSANYLYRFNEGTMPKNPRLMGAQKFMVAVLRDLDRTLEDDANFTDATTFARAVEQKVWGFLHATRHASITEAQEETSDESRKRLERMFLEAQKE
jgi:hypothetical protein